MMCAFRNLLASLTASRSDSRMCRQDAGGTKGRCRQDAGGTKGRCRQYAGGTKGMCRQDAGTAKEDLGQ